MAEYKWPPMEQRKLMGKRIARLDGPMKSSGRAKYPTDMNQPGLLFAVLLTSPHAHAKVKSIDVAPAKAIKGVTAVRVISGPGTEIQWAGTEVAAVSAVTEEIARDAAKAILVEYEVLTHLVKEENLAKVGPRAKAAGEQITGDPDKAFQASDAKISGDYGIPVITHC